MLHRSFKPAKCKTSLKLASSRIKLLKNKRDAQVKQLKRELAQLLEAGQDQTARIRVEHVVREEKTLAAYDLLEIYCELIVARLPIIESQKNCPIDLKEAISSVIFASPRCADVPELMDIRKHFTAKYGKEFVAAAVELRPDCGVSRMMIEKLSAKAPDGPTKIKILSAIADEHNIKWEPTSFGEKDPKIPEDLLNGPNTFEKSSQMLVDPPNVQAPPNFYDKGPPSVQVPPKHNEMHDVPVNLHEHNARSSPPSQSFAATDVGVNKPMSSSTSHSEVRPSGSGNKGMEFGHSYSGGGNASSFGRQNWNMEFKDATAAAQAAAESAERASMAARAAAELSSRGNITRQYSTESQKSSAYGLRDDQSQKYSGSTLQSDQLPKVPIDSTLHGRNSRMQYEHFNDNEEENPARVAEKFHREGLNSTGTSSRSASLKSTTGFVDDNNVSVNNFQMADRYSRKNSSDLGQSDSIGEVRKKKQSSESDVEFLNEVHDGRNSENVDYFEDVRIRNQSSRASSRSHSSTFGDDHDVVSDAFHDENENPFFVDDRRSVQRNTQETSAHEIASAVFDDSGSDDDVEGFGFSSPGRKSPFAVTDSWSLGQNTDDSQKKSFSQSHYSTVFSKNLTSSEVLSKLDDPLPVTFDDSDGPSSDIEEERDKSKLVGSTDHGSTVFSKNLPVTFDDSYGPSSDIEEERDESKLVGSIDHGTFPREQNVHSRNSEQLQGESHAFIESSSPEKGNLRSSKPLLRPSLVDSNDVDVHYDGSQTIEFGANSERKFGYGDVTISQSSSGFRKSQNDYRDSFNNPLDKGSNQQSQQSRFSMVHEVKDDDHMPQLADTMKDTGLLTESSLESGKELNFGTLTGGLRNKGYRRPPYTMSSSGNASAPKQAAEDTSYKVEQSSPTVWVSISSGADRQEPYNQKVSAEANKKTSTRAPVKYFDDSGDELPQRTFSSSEEPYNKKVANEENKRPSSTTPVTYFGSEICDSEEDFPKETSTGNARSNSEEDFPKETSTGNARSNAVFSRRTKASALNSKRSSNSNTKVLSETPVTPDYGGERKTSSRSSYATTETQRKPVSQSKSSDPWEGYVQPRLTASKPVSESKRSSREESSKASEREQAVLDSKRSSGEERKSSASNSLPKIVTSGSTETSNTSSSSGETLSGGKASHVHPKLPDFDSLTAHFQSLRQNRQ